MTTRTFACLMVAAAAGASAHAGVLGYSAFSRTASNGNVVVDLVVVTERASDRLLNVFNVQTTAAFVQAAGQATQGFRPDLATSSRSNSTDSFCTLGLRDGVPIGGEFFAPGSFSGSGVQPDGGFPTGWSSAASSIPTNAGWYYSPPTTIDALSENLANFSGDRRSSSAAAAVGQWGVWCGHWVFAPGTNSAFMTLNVSVKDGVTGATIQPAAQGFDQLPAPGAIALLGIAGAAGTRRRREV